MALFQSSKGKLSPVAKTDFPDEKSLQKMVEENLKTIFNCQFVASEFHTGAVHGGRIDTLALSEDGNPVIIEYKKVPSSDLLNQSLFYLAWIHDHKGDFQAAAHKALGSNTKIDWSDVRVICLAPSYKKYDLYAAQMMGVNIELWTYRRFANDSILFEEQQHVAGGGLSTDASSGKNPVMVAAGKKAAETKALGGWTLEQHLEGKTETIASLVLSIQEFLLGLDPSMEEAAKKYYIAYRTTQNIVCVEPQTQKILLFVKLDPGKHKGPPKISRDMRQIGHYGTGDLEITVRTEQDLELAKPFMQLAYEQVGG